MFGRSFNRTASSPLAVTVPLKYELTGYQATTHLKTDPYYNRYLTNPQHPIAFNCTSLLYVSLSNWTAFGRSYRMLASRDIQPVVRAGCLDGPGCWELGLCYVSFASIRQQKRSQPRRQSANQSYQSHRNPWCEQRLSCQVTWSQSGVGRRSNQIRQLR